VGAAELPVEEAFGLCGDGDIATPLSVHFSDPQHWNAALRTALDSSLVTTFSLFPLFSLFVGRMEHG